MGRFTAEFDSAYAYAYAWLICACVGLTDDVSGEIGCHHAWADSPVNVLSEVGIHGSVGRSHTCINLYPGKLLVTTLGYLLVGGIR